MFRYENFCCILYYTIMCNFSLVFYIHISEQILFDIFAPNMLLVKLKS